MTATTTPPTGPQFVPITIGGQQHPIKFTMNVLRDWSKFTGRSSNEFGTVLAEDYVEAFTSLILCAVHRFVPECAEITQEQIADVLDEMSQEEADALAGAIAEAATTVNPLLMAMSKQVKALRQAAPSEGEAGASTPATYTQVKNA